MNQLSLVIAQKNQAVAQQLADRLRTRFRQVAIARSNEEIEEAILKLRANAAIVDLEMLDPDALRELCHQFGRTAVVATHRSPDEEMWLEALELGAADCCESNDVEGILRAIAHNAVLVRAARAA